MSMFTSMLGFYVVVIVILGVCFIALGLRGMMTKRPFIVSSRKMLLIVALGFTPQLFTLGDLFFDENKRSIIGGYFPLFMLLFYAALGVFMWLQAQGYTVFGVTDDSFQTVLRATLRDLDLPYEETVSRMRLTSAGVDLQANVQSWMGVGHLRIKDREHKPLLRRIVAGMNERFGSSAVAVNMRTCAFYVAFGLLMFGMSGYMFKIRSDINALRLSYEEQADELPSSAR